MKIPTEVEWIIDNRYIAEREAKSVIADLKGEEAAAAKNIKGLSYMPLLFTGSLGKGEVNAERLRCFLENFQNALY